MGCHARMLKGGSCVGQRSATPWMQAAQQLAQPASLPPKPIPHSAAFAIAVTVSRAKDT